MAGKPFKWVWNCGGIIIGGYGSGYSNGSSPIVSSNLNEMVFSNESKIVIMNTNKSLTLFEKIQYGSKQSNIKEVHSKAVKTGS